MSVMPGTDAPPELFLQWSRTYPPYAALRVAGSSAAITWYGEIDLASVEECGRCVDDALAQDLRAVALDLRAVSFLDSSGLSVISRLVRGCAGPGRALLVVGPQTGALTALRLTGFLQVIDVAAAEELPAPLRELLAQQT